ncbi:MAG TPA: TRAP transporter small permease [Pseudolabrys sp.]|nr:TRAP transporter small permease [Pseudolabrys sp.]
MISRILDCLTWWIERSLAYAFIAAIGLNFINVIGRYGFGTTILSADELQIFIMVFMTFLGAAVVAWRGQHLRMDVLVSALPPSIRWLLSIIELTFIAVLTSFVMWNSAYYAQQMFNISRVSDMARVPMWIPHGVVVVGFGLIALICCLRLINLLAGHRSVGSKSGSEI